MQVPNPKLNLAVHLGVDNGQAMLARVEAHNHTGPQQVANLKQKAKLNEPIGDNLVCMIKYYVYPGREAQALKYMEQGFNQTIIASLRSPLQYITRKYDDEEAQNKIYSEEGAIVVQYRFKIKEEDQVQLAYLNKLSSFNKLKVELLLKGFVSHTIKNRTSVKVDYTYVNVVGDELDTALLNNLLSENDLIPEEVAQNPFFNTMMRAKKLHLALKLKSFRQMNKFYQQMSEAAGNSLCDKKEKEFKYTTPGLFREKTEAYAFLRDDMAVSGDITHGGEEIFMRLIKVYFKATKKLFDC